MLGNLYIARLRDGPVKLGVSNDVRRRVKGLQYSYDRLNPDKPCEITLAYTAAVLHDNDSAHLVERHAVASLAAYRLSEGERSRFSEPNEWFNTDVPTVIRAIEQGAVAADIELDTVRAKIPKGYFSFRQLRERYDGRTAWLRQQIAEARFPKAERTSSGFRCWPIERVEGWERRMIIRGAVAERKSFGGAA
jgi:hypothetical protein